MTYLLKIIFTLAIVIAATTAGKERNKRHGEFFSKSHIQANPYSFRSGINDNDVKFSKAHIQSSRHTFLPPPPTTVYSAADNVVVPIREAVESLPVQAQFYTSLSEQQRVDTLFSRGDVEAYPFDVTTYQGQTNEIDAYETFDTYPKPHMVLVKSFSDSSPSFPYNENYYHQQYLLDHYGEIGTRSAVESHPLTPGGGPFAELSHTYSQVNSRQYGHLSEATIGTDFDGESVALPNLHSRTGFGYLAGGDVNKFSPVIRKNAGDYKLICYYGAWSVYRPKPFDFGIQDIDPFSCTHLIYSFAGLKDQELTITSLDPELDVIQGAYKAAVGLKQKNPNLKVLIAIGGWNEGGRKYSKMSSSKNRRDKFVKSAVDFLKEHKFDGLDLDWEYPGASDRGGRWADKKNFADLVEELAIAFKPYRWVLSAAVSPAKFRVNEGYDVPRLSKHLDFINIMTYDLRGPWDGKADHHAPLTSKSTDSWSYKSLNTKDGINYWASKGAPKDKLIIGIPFYARTFTLANPANTKPGSRAKSGGLEGRYTQEKGFMSYYEICQEKRNGGWDMKKDEAGGSYMSKGDQWIGYDDTDYINEKMDLVTSDGLGGAMIWAMDLDDYLGVCGTRWPLLTTMRRRLFSGGVIPLPPPTIKPLPIITTTTESMPAITTTSTTTVAHTTLMTTGSPSTSMSSDTGSSSTTPVPPPTRDDESSTSTTVFKPAAPCQEGSFQRVAQDCSAFSVCIHGDYQRFSCQPPLQWNSEELICDWPSHVECQDKVSSDMVIVDGTTTASGTTATITPPPPTSAPSVVNPATPPTVVPSAGALSGDYMVVCYFTNWAWYRPGIGKYTPDDIDPTICTHVVYGFAVLDYSNLVIKPHDTWADFDNNFYSKVTDLKKHGTKVSIAIGGWNDSQGDKYSRLVNNPAARKKFIDHVIKFIEKHNFDGLDLDWEYPVCWQVNCERGPKSDKAAFASWVKELSAAFKPKGLLLSAAVSPSKKVIDLGYDVPVMSAYMDWIAVMTYDFHGHWDKKTGHVAPVYHHPEDDYDYFNMDYAIRYWIEKGAAKNKLVLGMPLYGQSFTLNDATVNGLNSPARLGGTAGKFTRARGFLAYYEICDAIQNGWTVVKDPEGRMGPYAYSGNQWVSFDDVNTLKFKSEYIRKMGLAGGMVWALDLDDFNNRCGQGAHPLMNTIKAVLGPPKSGGEGTAISVRASSGQLSTRVTDDSVKVICHFTNWAWYRPGEGMYRPEHIDPSLCTHIIYSFANLDSTSFTIKSQDAWTDIDNGFYEKVTDFKKHGLKVMLSLGGWIDSEGGKYSNLVNDPSARGIFINHVIKFIKKHNFDGLDLAWEFPVCWQVACGKGPVSDKPSFAKFVRELKMAFQPHGLLLSAAVSSIKKIIDKGYDIPTLNRYLDWISVMSYDFHGQWDKKTGHVSPMYKHPQDEDPFLNTNFTINYWLNNGIDRNKIIMGLPMYGQTFTLADSRNNGLNQKTLGGGDAGPYTKTKGFLAYNEICYFIQNQDWTVIRDPLNTMGPYAYHLNQWIGFDDVQSIKEKSTWIKEMGIGGAMIWPLDLDDFNNRCSCEKYPLLRTINRVLRNYPIPDPGCDPLGSTKNPVFKISLTQGTINPNNAFVRLSSQDKCTEGSFKKHETSCSKFHQCNFGVWEERSCVPGLHWGTENRCDWPKENGCYSGGPSPSPVAPSNSPPIPPRPPTTRPTTQPPTTRPTTQPPTRPPAPPAIADPSRPPPSSTISSPSPKPVHIPPTQPGSDYMVVCYFTNWAWYRQGAGKYKPEDIDHTLCTHVVYGFAVLDASRLLIKPHDTWADYDNKFYEKVTALKKHGVKVSIAIGGWNDSLGDKYSRLVNNPEARRRFIEHIIKFIQKHNFDGLDLDWEYPKCWQVDCKKGPESDKTAFTSWIRELHEAFQPHGFLLSAAVSPSYKVINAGYEVPALNRYFDWIAVMTYDYHGHWDKKTGHVAPMYLHPSDEIPEFNANYTIHYWLDHGADRKKLIMGMPLYGQSFSLASANDNGLNEKCYGRGTAGEFTRAGGFLAYYEICDRVLNRGFTVVRDPEGRMGPYAYKGNQWFSFDDIKMIRYKSNYIKQMGLGGGMIWALDLDDFRNRCGCENHPLLRTINRELRGLSIPDPGCTF